MGASPLHHAAQNGSVDAARALLEHGAFLNLQSPTHGLTPLMTAVWHRRVPLVAFLLKRPEINVAVVSTLGLTARGLIGFGTRGDDDLGQLEAIEMSALFDAYEQSRSDVLEAQPIFAILADDVDVEAQRRRIDVLLAEGSQVNTVSPVMSSGNDGHTPLLVAARDGLADLVATLLSSGADQTIADHYMRAFPIHKAAYMGHADVIRELAKDPAYRQVADAQGPSNGYTALHDAVWHGNTDAVRALLESGVRTDIRGFDGKTAYDLAREYRYEAIVKLLSDHSSS